MASLFMQGGLAFVSIVMLSSTMRDGRIVDAKIVHLANPKIPQVADVPGPSLRYTEV